MKYLASKLAILVAVVCAAGVARAVTLRKQVEQKGDFLIIGNTLGWDCGRDSMNMGMPVPPPVVGTKPADGMCGNGVDDSSPDVFWRADQPAGGATASLEVTAENARSTAVLNLPAGATVTYARLYWGALRNGTVAGASALVERPGASGFSQRVTADAGYVVAMAPQTRVYYQSTADVTELVAKNGSGAYRVGSIDVMPLNTTENTVFAGWTIVVFYRLDGEPQRNLALFEGLDRLQQGLNPLVTVNLTGFHVPQSGFDGKLGIIAYEGDDVVNGDYVTFNGTLLTNALNPPTDFFNGTRTWLGMAVSNPGDLPQLTGQPRTHTGLDLDVVNVTPYLKNGDTSATITATTTGDFYLLGAFITSIASYKPEFSNSTKTVRDLTNPMGPVRPGDTVEYTITVKNDGNDQATGVVMTDVLPMGLTYVPGSLQVTSGTGMGAKTDAAGDDQGEYLAPMRTLRVRLGAGANAMTGGTMEIGETVTIVFRATVDMGTLGTVIYNRATINAGGKTGNPPTDYGTASDPSGKGTPLAVDECAVDMECPMARPYCLTSVDPNICVECKDNTNCPMARPICSRSRYICVPMCATDADCGGATPACQPNGTCGQCSATNKSACVGTTPVCEVGAGKCVECLMNGDCPAGLPMCDTTTRTCVGCTSNADCPATKPFCDPMTKVCRGCNTDADCPMATPVCLPTGVCAECSEANKTRCTGVTPQCDTAAGKCVACTMNGHCPAATPFCDQATRTCRGCRADGECAAPTPYCEAASGRCVACTSNAMCSGTTPVCDAMSRACRTCAGDGECPMNAPACLPTGACGECSATNRTRCTGATPLCDTATNRCVACLTNADCSGPTPYCSPATRTCGPCEGDGAPFCTDPLRPACQRSGPLSGACTECSATNAGRCMGPKPICLPDLGLCGCTDADGDAECGGPTSGIVCSGPAGLCVPGCSTAPNRNRCPAPQVCSDTTGRIGTCVAAMACTTNADCMPPRPICDTAASPRACVQCLADAQCPAPLICDAMGTKICVECLPGRTNNCHATLSGSRCLMNNTCGCTTDGDCGGPTSGRVCDTMLGKCTVGCRGQGGNGCPAGLKCSSVTMAIGQCGSGDGGAPPDAARDAAPDAPRDAAPDLPRDVAVDAPRDAGAPDVPRDTAPDQVADARAPDGGADARPDARPADVRAGKGFLGGGGCACAVPGGDRSAPGTALLVPLLVGAGLLVRRRRRR